MGLFKIFSGKSSADHESTGDGLAQANAWGEAKLAFESALEKLAKQSPADPVMNDRLLDKLRHCKEALAMTHRQEAMELIDAGCRREAIDLIELAMELTSDPKLEAELTREIQQSSREIRSEIQDQAVHFEAPPEEPELGVIDKDADDYFNILLGALPEEVRNAYRSYGYEFKQGYLALNQGAFDQAVDHLLQAAEFNPSPQSLVPLELATAYVNLGQAGKAQALLEELVQHQPDLLPAFQLLCEIYWENHAFDQAMGLLDTLAPELAQSMGAYLLRGETLLVAARNEEAKEFYQGLLETYGWNETTALGLAKAFEGLDQMPQARDVYGQLISQCSGCGTRVDPSIKRKYADLSLASGQYTPKVLEYYLSLSQEDPVNAVQYCHNISRIYAAMGNETESMRFQSIAEDLARNQEAAN